MTELGEALALWLYEHGVKEDICGNSVRALWLDGALSGVRPDVPTDAPGRSSLPVQHRSDIPTISAAVSPLGRAQQRVRHSMRRMVRHPGPLALAVLGVVAGVVLTLIITARRVRPIGPATVPVAAAAPPAAHPAPVATAAAPPRAAPAAPASSAPPVAAAASESEVTKKSASEVVHRPASRLQRKAIRNFGF